MTLPGGVTETEITFDDAANARRFVAEFGANLRWHVETKRWLRWDGLRWAVDRKGAVDNLIQDFARKLYENAFSNIEERHARNSNNAKGLAAIEKLARTAPGVPVTTDELDANPYLLNVSNGTIDLKTGELLVHNRADLITKLAPFPYNEAADSSLFETFINSIQPDDDIKNYLQTAFGLSLSGITRRAFFIFHGFGRNGKSVLVDLFSTLLGDYALNTTAESLMKKSLPGVPNDIARMKGARFITVAETNENDPLNAALMKSLTGGDRITARFLFGEFFDFYFSAKVFFPTNHKPPIHDQSDGMWNRVKLVPFKIKIADDDIIDKEILMEQLLSEAAGILAWAVAGFLRFQRDGLVEPEIIKEEIAQYRFEQDSIAQFLAESCIEGTGAEYRIDNTRLYEKYQAFCRANGEFQLSHRKLTQSLTERGFVQVRYPLRLWHGLKLLE